MSGLDSRFLLNDNPNLNRICNTLMTVNSPNQGSFFADLYTTGKVNRFLIDRLSMTFGMSPESFVESNRANIRDLNEYLDDFQDERIFTFGASKDYPSHSSLFKETSKILLEDLGNDEIDSDGVLFSKESILNSERNLGILNADNYQMTCFASDKDNSRVYSVCIDFCKQRFA